MSQSRCNSCGKTLDECGMLAKLACCGGHVGAYCGSCMAGHKGQLIRDQLQQKLQVKGRELVEDLGVLFDDFFGQFKGKKVGK